MSNDDDDDEWRDINMYSIEGPAIEIVAYFCTLALYLQLDIHIGT